MKRCFCLDNSWNTTMTGFIKITIENKILNNRLNVRLSSEIVNAPINERSANTTKRATNGTEIPVYFASNLGVEIGFFASFKTIRLATNPDRNNNKITKNIRDVNAKKGKFSTPELKILPTICLK